LAIMKNCFIDPVTHSRRVERIQLSTMTLVFLSIIVFSWIRWFSSDGKIPLQIILLVSAGTLGAGSVVYYMTTRVRMVLREHSWLEISESGVVSSTPTGIVEMKWDEISKIQIGKKPSKTKSPDIMIRSGFGQLGIFMRWVDKSGPIPEPVIWSPSSKFLYPDGKTVLLSPDNSGLVSAIKRFAPETLIEEGVLISI
jgi:hypothetical protein